MRWIKSFALAMLLGLSLPAFAEPIQGKLYKNPHCGCCEEYAKHLEANGFDIELIETTDLDQIKQKHNIPRKLEACHTTLIEGRVFEGHVFAEDIKRLLREQPMMRGLAVPGMPVGTPGMPGKQRGPIHVYYLQDGAEPKVFATH